MKVGERVWNLERLFNLKAGFTKLTIHYRNGFLSSLWQKDPIKELCITCLNCYHLLPSAWLE